MNVGNGLIIVSWVSIVLLNDTSIYFVVQNVISFYLCELKIFFVKRTNISNIFHYVGLIMEKL